MDCGGSIATPGFVDLHVDETRQISCPVFRIAAGNTNTFVILADPPSDGVPFVSVVEIFELDGRTPANRQIMRRLEG